jgi:hypothetical protein
VTLAVGNVDVTVEGSNGPVVFEVETPPIFNIRVTMLKKC